MGGRLSIASYAFDCFVYPLVADLHSLVLTLTGSHPEYGRRY